MKRINTLCVLILLLVTSSITYAGVTDGDVTAYRPGVALRAVVFTDDPLDDPDALAGPLGAGFLSGTTCTPTFGSAGVKGLVCIGTSGDPIETYTCTAGNGPPNATNTTWCLFSENPRTGGKAWAVKYVSGDIPTNDGTSIVRCEGTDLFDPVNGCGPSPPAKPTLISVEDGYIKLDTINGSALPDADCSETAHYGRMIVDEAGDRLYICTQSGWTTKSLTPVP